MRPVVHIGTAGWQVPKAFGAHFPTAGSHLERYSMVLNAVEVNSTFYRLPRASTAERWAASVPAYFRFALKLPKRITHEQLLRHVATPMKAFMEIASALGDRMGPILVQLPPKLGFTPAAEDFLAGLHEHDPPLIALEPRHPSWFSADVDGLLKRFHIACVAADPPRAECDGTPGGYGSLVYFRLHGSPRIYRSEYVAGELQTWARRAERSGRTAEEVWIIFDNTALGAAAGNALQMSKLLK